MSIADNLIYYWLAFGLVTLATSDAKENQYVMVIVAGVYLGVAISATARWAVRRVMERDNE